MVERKIVFLDIDGVLNSERFFVTAPMAERESMIDKEAVKLLNQLEGTEIVVTSSWGEDGGETERRLKDAGLDLPIVGYTNKVHYKFDWACRGNEIEKWVIENIGDAMGTKYGSEYKSKSFSYVIFDDDQDMLYGQKDNFIYVNRFYGLTSDDIKKAKKILTLK